MTSQNILSACHGRKIRPEKFTKGSQEKCSLLLGCSCCGGDPSSTDNFSPKIEEGILVCFFFFFPSSNVKII